jgi:hypothetical protein
MKDAVVSGTGASYTFSPVNHDRVYAILRSNYACRLNNADTSAQIIMTIDTPLTPVVSISASPGTLVSQGQTVTLTATVVNGGTSPTYQWLKNGVPITGATNATYSSNNYNYPAPDSVTCMVTAVGFCTATAYSWVYINVALVGVKNIAGTGAQFSILPNPNKGTFTIKGALATTNDQEVGLEITDMLGQVVYTGKLQAKSGKLDQSVTLHNIANGMYLLTLRTEAGSEVVHMVIEQ